MTLRIFILLLITASISFAQEEYMREQLEPIKQNFTKINTVKNWTKIIKKELWESTEGGEAQFFYQEDSLFKIVVRSFGETRQAIHEFYLLNGQLSFSYYKETIYNRPLLYDSTSMIENNDNQVFDIKKSEIIEERSYFSNGQLIRQINNQDCGSPFSKEYLDLEYKRLSELFTTYKKMTL